jgi:hypothetical protein
LLGVIQVEQEDLPDLVEMKAMGYVLKELKGIHNIYLSDKGTEYCICVHWCDHFDGDTVYVAKSDNQSLNKQRILESARTVENNYNNYMNNEGEFLESIRLEYDNGSLFNRIFRRRSRQTQTTKLDKNTPIKTEPKDPDQQHDNRWNSIEVVLPNDR